MARAVVVKMDRAGSKALLYSQAVHDDLQERVAAVAQQAGPGFEATVTKGWSRWMARVEATTPEAEAAEQNDRALTRALDAAR